ncbi:hypothetical protein KPH14_013084, partial [Odynerus spinipes]
TRSAKRQTAARESGNDNVCCVCLESTQYVTAGCNHQLCPRCLLTIIKFRRKAFMAKVPAVYSRRAARLAHFRVREFNRTEPYSCPMCRTCMNDVIGSRLEFENMDQEYDRSNSNSNAQLTRYSNRSRRAIDDSAVPGDSNRGNPTGSPGGSRNNVNDEESSGGTSNSRRTDPALPSSRASGGGAAWRAIFRLNLPVDNSAIAFDPSTSFSQNWFREVQNRIVAVEDHATDSDDMDFDVSDDASGNDGISATVDVNLLDELDDENVEYFVRYIDFS